ncbi:MAG: XdhC family protein [Chitinophagaceae bacterium]
MKIEFENIINAYRKIDFSSSKAALATIVNVRGSSYRRPGARMLITDDGNWTGAISGGCLERDALKKALSVIRNNKARMVTYDTTDEDENAFGIGLGCNGIIDVLMEPLDPVDKTNPLELLDQLLSKKEQAIMVTMFGENGITGQRKLFKWNAEMVSTVEDNSLEKQLDEKIKGLSADTRTQIWEMETGISVLIEVLRPDIQLLVFGTGYDVIPLVKMAKLAGCHVTVINDNPNHLNNARFSDADDRLFCAEKSLNQLPVSINSAAILISHNFNYDLAVLQQMLQTEIAYIGILGPHKKGIKLLEKIQTTGEKDLQRIYNPVGLDIGAETPEEIALSIIAEIKAVFNGRSGQMLRYRKGPIYS